MYSDNYRTGKAVFSFLEVDVDKYFIGREQRMQNEFFPYFHDASWAMNTAAGWHRCLDVFSQIVLGKRQIGKIIQQNYVRLIAKLLV